MAKDYYSTNEVAEILHMSRVGVFKRIRNGKIKGEKVGRNYIIRHKDLVEALGKTLSAEKKENIKKAVGKATRQYEKVFKRLGEE